MAEPARAAVGPLPAEALVLPADARFVMGFDVKRFTASPFYARFASERGMQPEALRELEEKTGLNPARDVDQIVVVGTAGVPKGSPGLAMALGRFDLYKIGRALETEGKATGQNVAGVSVYIFKEEKEAVRRPGVPGRERPPLRAAGPGGSGGRRAARAARRRSRRTPSSWGSSRRCAPGSRSGWWGTRACSPGCRRPCPPRGRRPTGRP